MASLPAPPRRSLDQRVGAFWRWWTGELARLVPERFAALGGGTRAPQVELDGGTLVLVDPKPVNASAARVDLAQGERARPAVRAMLERAGEKRMRARLLLAEHEALVRRASLPAATEENLGQVLGFEMDRLTPFRADEVYFDYRVASRDPAAGTIAILLAVARRDLVDARVARLREAGITVEGVVPRQETAQGAGALNLMPSELRGERETPNERKLKIGLGVAVGLLLLAVLLYPPWAKRRAIIERFPLEAKAQSEAQATSRLADELERLVNEYNFLLAKKHGNPPTLAYVEELTRLLPDNTWVQQLDLKSAGKTRELQIQGETVSSSKLIEILEQSTLLRNAQTRGTVTRGSVPGTERFAIAAEARGRPLPESISVAQMSTPVAPATQAGTAPAPAAAPPKAEPPKAEPPKAEPSKAPAKVEPAAPPKPAADPKGAKPAPGK